MMNKKRILKLADALAAKETPVPKFSMSEWFVTKKDELLNYASSARSRIECGTTACLAGHTVTLFRRVKTTEDYIPGSATEILGLDWSQQSKLFTPRDNDDRLIHYSRAHAVKTLRHLAETGEVKW